MYLHFHQTQTRLAFFEAAAVCDYQSTLSIQYHDHVAVIEVAEAFQKRQPRLNIPRLQERMYDLAGDAADHLDLTDKKWQLTKKQQEWLEDCNFMELDGTLTDNEISDYELAIH